MSFWDDITTATGKTTGKTTAAVTAEKPDILAQLQAIQLTRQGKGPKAAAPGSRNFTPVTPDWADGPSWADDDHLQAAWDEAVRQGKITESSGILSRDLSAVIPGIGAALLTGGLAAPALAGLGTVGGAAATGALAGAAGGAVSNTVGNAVNNETLFGMDTLESAGTGAAIGGIVGGAGGYFSTPSTGAIPATTFTDTGLSGPIPSGLAGDAIAAANPLPGLGPLAGGTGGSTPTGVTPTTPQGPPTPPASSLIPGISNTALGLGALGTATSVAGGIIGANAQSDAIKDAAAASGAASDKATDATLQGTREIIAAGQKQYDQDRADFKPFRDLAPKSLAAMESSIYDGPQEKFDLAGLAREQTDSLNNFNPKETEAYKWQMDKGLEGLDRTLRMQGRGSGSVATNAALNFAGNLNATEYDKGYQRLSSLNDLNYNRTAGRKTDYQNSLLNLIKTAQGAAGSTSAAGQTFTNTSSKALSDQTSSLTSLAINDGNNRANTTLVGGASKNNLYGGLASIPFQLGSLAIQGGYKPFG